MTFINPTQIFSNIRCCGIFLIQVIFLLNLQKFINWDVVLINCNIFKFRSNFINMKYNIEM